MIRLTDEEISKVRYKYNELYKGGVFEHTMRPNHCELVASAQLKKVLDEAKTEDLSWKFRQALLEETQ